ncbi:class I SAM-dependent methyltransferase [Clostridioides sp. ES-S-0049-03]|uniref:class I SAM-dependent methyltransferase n=1 Tax=Clostridioides sp. ES-S-0049-03 TaxID=2770779 RepID=UPI001D11D141
MSYPTAIQGFSNQDILIDTIDIREDSRANLNQDYLEFRPKEKYDLIITNPPFNISLDIINKALNDVKEDGFVIMLLRLNYLGGKIRQELWQNTMPKYVFVHNKRMSFTDDKKTDSIEYAHFVWQKGYNPNFSKLKVLISR